MTTVTRLRSPSSRRLDPAQDGPSKESLILLRWFGSLALLHAASEGGFTQPVLLLLVLEAAAPV